MFVPVKILIDKILRHPLLSNLNEEYILDYVVECIGLVGVPELYEEKCEVYEVKDHRVKLPDTLVSLRAVRDNRTKMAYVTSSNRYNDDDLSFTYKLQGNILFLGTDNNEVEVLYSVLPVDKEGYPKISDDPAFLRVLETYIKQQALTVQFDLGKIHPSILQNAQQEYCWAVKHYTTRRKVPTIDQMESIKNVIRGVSNYHHTNSFKKANLE